MIQQPSNVAELRAAWRVVNRVRVEDSPCFKVVNAADASRLYVYGMIGGWDMDAQEFVQAVHAIDSPTIDLHINSQGGFVWDAVSMYESLRAHPATVRTHVDGLAASAASFLALAGDTVDTAKGTRWMVHDAQMVAIGSPADLRESADLGDAVSNDIAGIYSARAGGSVKSWRTAMTKTTWYSAQEAVDVGLATRVTGNDKSNSGASNRSRLIKARAAVALGGVK